MNLWNTFFLGLYFENIFIWHAVGLGMIILFSYTMIEVFWVSLRFLVFLIIQTIVLILIRPWFDFSGKELFLLLALIGSEVLLSIFIDVLLPSSHLEDSIHGFVRRGDAILPLVLSVIIQKQSPPLETIVYSIGLGLGAVLILVFITTMSISFHFHRLNSKYSYALKLIILGILSIISY